MKCALTCALALAVTNTALALTLPSGNHTSLGAVTTVAAVRPAPDTGDRGLSRPRLAAVSPPSSWTVKPGESLSAIAAKAYGSRSLWPALWWINKAAIRNPDVIMAGQVIKLSRWHPAAAWLDHAALRAIPAPPPLPVRHFAVDASRTVHRAYHRGYTYTYHRTRAYAAPQTYRASSGTYRGSGGYESCVISRESGGNARAVNASSGAGGLYQFLPSTWHSLGYSGSPQNAPISVQRQAFHRLYAQAGTSPWSPSDGC